MTAHAAKKAPPPYGAVALRKEVIAELDRLAGLMGLTREELAEKALLTALEDFDDEFWAGKVLKDGNKAGEETVSLEEVERRLGLDRRISKVG